jgi:poly-gamma-glutamate synthesis protein (capsule biosynthesis protein)
MRRRKDRFGKHVRYQKRKWTLWAAITFFVLALSWPIYLLMVNGSKEEVANSLNQSSQTESSESASGQKKSKKNQNGTSSARIMAHGDLLYHDLLYMSAKQEDGTYDFRENFTYVKPWIEAADLAIADFEGTISSDFPLAGYPLFNAPAQVVTAIKDAGYDLVDLAHNHILDSQLSGLISTSKHFTDAGIGTVGVYPEGNRSSAPLQIRDINGIKVAILAYAYGFNGMEGNLSLAEQAAYLSDFNVEKMQAEIERAEKEADITIIMPQTGVEYQLEPSPEQRNLYHQMVEWGADLIFGGHPHVTQPAEVVEKDGQEKLIIYSMGNFISNQRIETMEGVSTAQWTERGVLMDVTIEKKDGVTTIQKAEAHPTWVSRVANGRYAENGQPLYSYQTFILEDFIEGGQHRDKIDEATKIRIDSAYHEMKEFMGLNW